MTAARALLAACLTVGCAAETPDVPARATVPVATVASAAPFGPPRPPRVEDLTADRRAELRRLVRELERDARHGGFCGTAFAALAGEIEARGEVGWLYAAQVTRRPRTVAEARAFAVEAIRVPRVPRR